MKNMIWLLLVMGMITGCAGEDEIVPTGSEGLVRFEFPQGTSEWDRDAEEIYDKFRVFLIYKGYRDDDFMRAWVMLTGSGYYGSDLNDEQAAFYMNFMKNHVFVYLNPEVFTKVLPVYWYLARDFFGTATYGSQQVRQAVAFNYGGMDYWVTNLDSARYDNGAYGISQKVRPSTPEEMLKARGEMLLRTMLIAYGAGVITYPPGFHDGFDYTTKFSNSTNNPVTDPNKENPNYYIVRGFPGKEPGTSGFRAPTNLSNAAPLTSDRNFQAYINMCMYYSREEYEALWPPTNKLYQFIHAKRKMVIDHFKDAYGIDLEAIQRGPELLTENQ